MDVVLKIMHSFWAGCEKKDAARLAQQSPTPGIHEVNNLVYKDDGHEYHKLDIYWPDSAAEKLPVVFDIHGGGWMYGDKDLNKYYCLKLASKGFAVVNISYRLVPEVRLDGQLRDIFRALDFIDRHAAEYPLLDMSRFFITGDSAGGELALLTTVFQKNEKLREQFGVRQNGLTIRAAGIVCGFNNWKKVLSIPGGKGYARLIFGSNYATSPLGGLMVFADVIDSVPDLPPYWLLSSKEDFIGKQTLGLEQLLKQKNKKYKIRVWGKGKTHTLEHVFNILYPEWRESEISNNDMLDFFLQQVKDEITA